MISPLNIHLVICELTESVESIGFTLLGLAEIDICKVEAFTCRDMMSIKISFFMLTLYRKNGQKKSALGGQPERLYQLYLQKGVFCLGNKSI